MRRLAPLGSVVRGRARPDAKTLDNFIPLCFLLEHAEIKWRVIAGMRDQLIHGYFGVDFDIVWNVATRDAAVLKEQLRRINTVTCAP